MHLAAVFVAILPLMASPCLAQNVPVLSVTQVSYGLPAEALAGLSTRAFPAGDKRDVEFDLGRAEGSGFDDAPVKRIAPRATVRVGQESASRNRTTKPFVVPWQTGVFQ